MTKLRYQLCIFLALSVLSFYLAASTTLRLAYSDIESYPYQMGNGRAVPEPPGLALEIIDQAVNSLDIKVEYIRVPGKRVLQYIKEGKVDGGFIFSYNAKRAQYASYPLNEGKPDNSKRITTLGYYFYKQKGSSFDWDGVNPPITEQKEIGAHLGFSIVGELKKKQIKVHEVRNTAQLFGMLKSERLAAIAIQDTMAQAFIKGQNWSNVEQVQPAIITKDYYLVFSPKFAHSNSELVKAVWSNIADFRDEVIAESISKY